MINPQSIEKLLSVVDIVDVVQSYIPLRRSGRNFIGVCPFHDDKNPSMSVNSQMGIFHCFSCKAGGDALKFIMEYEKIGFIDAAQKLAQRYNFSLEYTTEQNSVKTDDKKILEKLNAFYISLLHKNKPALNYLHSRGINDELIAKFELGFAPQSHISIALLENENILPHEALQVGVVKEGEHGFYASFVERITFPIHSHTGKLIGFGGRTLSNHPAKYVNSPQSEIFDKSRVLYGFDKAKRAAYDKKELIVVEGYMDTIMLHSAGFTNAVAVLGTALTPKHIPLIKRADMSVILSFDGDNAGINAAVKSARLLSTNQIDGSVVTIKDGLDPADMIAAKRGAELAKMYENGMEMGEFYIRQIAKNFDLTRPQLKQKALEAICEFTKELTPLVAHSYDRVVSEILDVSTENFSLNNSPMPRIKSPFAPNLRLQPQKDYLELQVLKSMLQSESNRDIVMNLCDEDCFLRHQELFKQIASRCDDLKFEFKKVDGFSDHLVLKEAAKTLKIGSYKRLIERLKHSNDEKKYEKIFQLNSAIILLKGKR